MKLRTKTVIIFVVMTLLLVGTMHEISYTILLQSYGRVEQNEVSLVGQQVNGALLNQYSALNSKLGDWALWDDSYKFVQDNNSAFAQTNLIPLQFINLGLNFIFYFNSSGRYVNGMAFNLINDTQMPVPGSLLTMITNNSQIWNFQDLNASLVGPVLTSKGPLLLASRPILTTAGEGPIRGALIFGRYLDQQYVATLSKTVHFPLSLTLYGGWQAPFATNSFTSTVPSIYVHPVNATSIAAYDVENDIFGRPALVLGATTSRVTYQQGLVTLNYADISVITASVFFSLAMLVLTERVVLSRLHKLATDVETIGGREGVSSKVTVSGNDELASLSKSINKMLGEIESKTRQLRRAERFSAIGELATMVAHDLRNPLQGIANATFYLKRVSGPSGSAKQKEVLDTIEEDVKYSDKIVNDLLDYSRDIRLELTSTNPQLLLKEALVKIMVPENFRIIDETETYPTLNLDVDKMKRTFINLINNAIDAMPDGGSILIQSKVSDHKVDFVFADSGIGIGKEALERLFTPLYTTKAKGMGFGLSISKRIVEAHGGTISAVSTLGKGTTFTISLPVIADSKEVKILE